MTFLAHNQAAAYTGLMPVKPLTRKKIQQDSSLPDLDPTLNPLATRCAPTIVIFDASESPLSHLHLLIFHLQLKH